MGIAAAIVNKPLNSLHKNSHIISNSDGRVVPVNSIKFVNQSIANKTSDSENHCCEISGGRPLLRNIWNATKCKVIMAPALGSPSGPVQAPGRSASSELTSVPTSAISN